MINQPQKNPVGSLPSTAPKMLERAARTLAALVQLLTALLPNLSLYLIRRRFQSEPTERTRSARLRDSFVTWLVAIGVTGLLFAASIVLMIGVAIVLWEKNWLHWAVYSWKSNPPTEIENADLAAFIMNWATMLLYASGVFAPRWIDQINESAYGLFRSLMRRRFQVIGPIQQALGTVMLLGLSLLPLASLLLVVPAVMPEESVLTDTVRPSKSRWLRAVRRLIAAATGIALLIALLAFATEVVTQLGLKSPYFGKLARMVLSEKLADSLPGAMVDQWPYVFLIVYATDLMMLLFIGKVPIAYNIRNLVVRWRTTVLTGLAFTLVLGLLTGMLAFVNGLNNLTSNSGIPGNVFVLSEGATDELFSSLYKGDIEKIELESTTTDADGNPLPAVLKVKEITGPSATGKVRLCSYETYFVINQAVAVKAGEKPRRRFVQLRGMADSYIAAKVHNVELLEGDWFGREGGVDVGGGKIACPAILGEGAAAKFAEDLGKSKLKVGDQFKLGDLDMVVSGIMKSEGSTFGSEVWATWKRVADAFNKTQYTTVVLRVNDDSEESARIFAKNLSANFKNPRIRAVDEKKYFEDLGKSNDQMLTSVIIVAIIMAIGGVFGVMNTMFAAIAQRTKDIGVMRILGFKRWQILVSFMLETLAIALLGGLAGIALGTLFDGWQMTSNVSSGQGGGKTVIMRLAVDADIVICGVLFTMVMGRVGGLVPALSAMRLGILDSLK
jgi:putative ABC transport system permease protein